VISVIKFRRSMQYLFLTIVSLLSIFPMLWMIISATNKSLDVIRGRLLPGAYLIENLKNLIKTQNVGRAMMNCM
jgi:lactose/L-arabinose transport system permease protein